MIVRGLRGALLAENNHEPCRRALSVAGSFRRPERDGAAPQSIDSLYYRVEARIALISENGESAACNLKMQKVLSATARGRRQTLTSSPPRKKIIAGNFCLRSREQVLRLWQIHFHSRASTLRQDLQTWTRRSTRCEAYASMVCEVRRKLALGSHLNVAVPNRPRTITSRSVLAPREVACKSWWS